MQEKISKILFEINKAVIGKKEVIEKLLTAVLAGGHVLLDDVPGVGKTTLAITIGKVLGLNYKRIQFTPDVLPSDITGFSIYDRESGEFVYKKGVLDGANILLGDEINRTSSKTQSALLEAMEENQVTVDGISHPLLAPFLVIATQNHVGTAGTQLLPYTQLDRFLMKLSMGYPDLLSQMEIISNRQVKNPLSKVMQITDKEEVLKMQDEVTAVSMKSSVIEYIARIAAASRDNALLELGISPRGAIMISHAAKASAYVKGRDFVTPEDVLSVLYDVTEHRVMRSQGARVKQILTRNILESIASSIKIPEQK